MAQGAITHRPAWARYRSQQGLSPAAEGVTDSEENSASPEEAVHADDQKLVAAAEQSVPDRRQRRSNTKPEVSNASGFNGVEVDADGFVVAINGRAIF